MNNNIPRLAEAIRQKLTPLITCDYVLIDLPYYMNIGDHLIWEGTRQFLATLPHKCLGAASFQTFRFPELSRDTVILMQGGGNFGDLYEHHQDFRLKVIGHYPDNPIVILPQSTFYKDTHRVVSDAQAMRQHKRLTICARDGESLRMLQRFHFGERLLLVPDMAFMIDREWLKGMEKTENGRSLLFKRLDGEFLSMPQMEALEKTPGMDVHDWPSFEETDEVCDGLFDRLHRNPNPDFPKVDAYACEMLRPHLIRMGVEMLSQYHTIYTTRLHAAILGWLLGKEVHLLDNTTGKLSAFYDTWHPEEPVPTPLPDVSIILPVYNVETYIRQCLQSITSQDYKGRIECLIIDDCGTDGSIAAIETFIAQYQGAIHFRIIRHEKNRGLSAARNTGMLYADGRYLFFMDSDDTIAPDCLSRLSAETMKHPDVQMVMGGVEMAGDKSGRIPMASGGLHQGDAIQESCQYRIYTMAWNKLIRRDLLTENKLFFVEGLLHEDVLWFIQVACNLDRYAVVEHPTYYYNVRQGSIQTNAQRGFHLHHMMQVCCLLMTYIFETRREQDRLLRQFVMSLLLPRLTEMPEKDGWKTARAYYDQIRNTPHWNTREHRPWVNLTEKRLLKSFRLSPSIGFLYFHFYVRWDKRYNSDK